jgi:hypothetical protein
MEMGIRYHVVGLILLRQYSQLRLEVGDWRLEILVLSLEMFDITKWCLVS